jgi:hypothetical protein
MVLLDQFFNPARLVPSHGDLQDDLANARPVT